MTTGLVVSTPLENMKVNWDVYSQYMKNMFQTTNQIMSLAISILLVSLLQHLEPKMAGLNALGPGADTGLDLHPLTLSYPLIKHGWENLELNEG